MRSPGTTAFRVVRVPPRWITHCTSGCTISQEPNCARYVSSTTAKEGPGVAVALLLDPAIPRAGLPPDDADVVRNDPAQHAVELRSGRAEVDEDVHVAARAQLPRLRA